MRFMRRHRFLVVFVALLVFCSLMVVRQVKANQSKHLELRDDFIRHCIKGYKPEAERLYILLLRDIEQLPDKTLIDDYRQTRQLVDPAVQQPENLIWKYCWTVKKELRTRKLAQEE